MVWGLSSESKSKTAWTYAIIEISGRSIPLNKQYKKSYLFANRMLGCQTKQMVLGFVFMVWSIVELYLIDDMLWWRLVVLIRSVDWAKWLFEERWCFVGYISMRQYLYCYEIFWKKKLRTNSCQLTSQSWKYQIVGTLEDSTLERWRDT